MVGPEEEKTVNGYFSLHKFVSSMTQESLTCKRKKVWCDEKGYEESIVKVLHAKNYGERQVLERDGPCRTIS